MFAPALIAAMLQAVTVSPAPDSVALTIYREPGRPPDRRPNLDWLNGYALVTETRTVAIPAGESDLRFEGVAGGIIPESVIVSGLESVIERNRDAMLLSPGSLVDRSLGRRVTLRRTSLATGVVREEGAVIRTSGNGGVVIQTEAGFEGLRCTGLAETLIPDSVPADLSARPTLSVRTRSAAPVTATISLSYLATGFDWQANYVATLAPAGDRVDLFAWVTLANGDETGFARADTQAVAGRLNREAYQAQPAEAPPLTLQCWPAGTTSDPVWDGGVPAPPAPPPPPPPMAMMESIVVTGSRAAMTAVQEELGDLKFYRIPEPVTVAARSQKQVAMLSQPDVKVALVHRRQIGGWDEAPVRAGRWLVARNRAADGLGLPIPAGSVALFVERDGRPILIGEGAIDDRAIGEDVEIGFGEGSLMTEVRKLSGEGEAGDYELVVTNDSAIPARFEADFVGQGAVSARGRSLSRRNGRPLWTTTVPANGRAVLRYRAWAR